MPRSIKKPAPISKRRSIRVSDAELNRMIKEATVDAYGESEQTVGFLTMLDDNLAVPFRTEVFGVEVRVVRVCVTDVE